jgi:hypothetical protein
MAKVTNVEAIKEQSHQKSRSSRPIRRDTRRPNTQALGHLGRPSRPPETDGAELSFLPTSNTHASKYMTSFGPSRDPVNGGVRPEKAGPSRPAGPLAVGGLIDLALGSMLCSVPALALPRQVFPCSY